MVAPHTGAWIETLMKRGIGLFKSSHPTRVRGLKRAENSEIWVTYKSHPTRVRGLKQSSGTQVCQLQSRTPHGCVD